MASQNDYHLLELSIAKKQCDQRRIMPVISGNHRRILDVGCGAGQTLIASDLDPDVFAVGVDVDQSALALGKKLSTRVGFVCAKGEALSFPSEHFDLVISRVALPYMHIPRTLAEIWRVLKMGGDLWVALHPLSMLTKDLIEDVKARKLKRVVYELYVLSNGLTLHLLNKQFKLPLTGSRFESFQTDQGISRALRSAGFAEIKISRDNFFVVTAKKTAHKLPPRRRGSDGLQRASQ
jgi:ubiquinone/menaquinone biosynthesis C-methylase UbiE